MLFRHLASGLLRSAPSPVHGASTNIRSNVEEKLSGSVKEDYQTIADNVSILYDTPMYNEFVKTIRNVFSDVYY